MTEPVDAIPFDEWAMLNTPVPTNKTCS